MKYAMKITIVKYNYIVSSTTSQLIIFLVFVEN